MSRQYDEYLVEHIGNVKKAWIWMLDNIIPDFTDELGDTSTYDISQLIDLHDGSKHILDEYRAYDEWFYGNKSYAAKQNFEKAFLTHIHRNPHHWQYWVLIHDDPDEPETIIEMEVPYIFEMICDWWSFSWKKGDLTEIFSWYDKHKDYIRLGTKTRKLVETILDAIKAKLEEENYDG